MKRKNVETKWIAVGAYRSKTFTIVWKSSTHVVLLNKITCSWFIETNVHVKCRGNQDCAGIVKNSINFIIMQEEIKTKYSLLTAFIKFFCFGDDDMLF